MTITIHVQDNSLAPVNIVGAQVQVWQPDGVTLLAAGLSDASGNFVFPKPVNGSYEVEVRKSLVQFPSTSTITIAADGENHLITGVPNTATAPSVGNRCTVFGYNFRGDGRPTQATVLVKIVGKGSNAYVPGGGTTTTGQVNTAPIIADTMELRSDSNTGYWSADLAWNTLVSVTIYDLGYTKYFRVPEVSSINVVDIVQELSQATAGVLMDTPSTSAYKGIG